MLRPYRVLVALCALAYPPLFHFFMRGQLSVVVLVCFTAAYLAFLSQREFLAGQLLAAFSYRGVLARGFALVRDGEGRPLRSAAAVTARMRLEIEFSDGRVGATADGGDAPPATARGKPRARGGEGPSGQGSLFGA